MRNTILQTCSEYICGPNLGGKPYLHILVLLFPWRVVSPEEVLGAAVMPENLAPWLLSFLLRLRNTHTNSITDLLKTCLHNLQSYQLLL
jgi:hypothetical protein